MIDKSDGRWRTVAKWFRIIGGVCSVAFFLSYVALGQVYYPSYRPEVPQPERGFTIGLTWIHPVRYGTERDEKRLECLFELFFPAFGLIIAGELIKIYRLGDYSGLRRRQNPPWDQKWGP